MLLAVDALYHAFRRYPQKKLDYCPCGCTSEWLIDVLETAPLRELRPQVAASYAFKAVTTIGDDRDLRRFLPRLLELAVQRDTWIDSEILLAKLRQNGWSEWPADERAVVEVFLQSWWDEVVSSADEEHAANLISAIAQAVDDLQPYLERWHPDPGIEERTILLENAWWADRPKQRAQVEHWLAGGR